MFYYLYLIEDIYSRKFLGREIHEKENSEFAAVLMQRTVMKGLRQRQGPHQDSF
jgi:putative transposase